MAALSGTRIACFGGVYNNYLAFEAALGDAKNRGVDACYCLGDLGAFGPHPDRVFPLIDQHQVLCLQGNYDDSIGNQLDDCQCGYTDPRDNHFAQISYDYTLRNTSAANREFMRSLPAQRRLELGPLQLLLCHGSPRKVNEFLWESTTPTHFLEWLAKNEQADVIAATHTGIKWERTFAGPRGPGRFVNVGVLGRPENDGARNVWYTLLEHRPDTGLQVEFVPVEYDYLRLAREMQAEGLPQEFIETVHTGWWTTCLEVLPSKERLRGKH
ncbi:metallophosphoesterase family protein [Lignipirellula cremea]|uniref:Calcineurin-like phosphoesterase superfamily domain protein n=1 Tax=Lignipirellula cremea TaxID=2528010 RepID=A0A518DNI9_9BACT|nr:metallophosphoesterase family protein [Lignipirellula cremea]QDU93408.1 Calcineurin-like phosphoesterase superfamily domain protein [Lignipirellula cremea]